MSAKNIAVWERRFALGLKEIEAARDQWRYPGPLNVPVPRTFAETPPR